MLTNVVKLTFLQLKEKYYKKEGPSKFSGKKINITFEVQCGTTTMQIRSLVGKSKMSYSKLSVKETIAFFPLFL